MQGSKLGLSQGPASHQKGSASGVTDRQLTDPEMPRIPKCNTHVLSSGDVASSNLTLAPFQCPLCNIYHLSLPFLVAQGHRRVRGHCPGARRQCLS